MVSKLNNSKVNPESQVVTIYHPPEKCTQSQYMGRTYKNLTEEARALWPNLKPHFYQTEAFYKTMQRVFCVSIAIFEIAAITAIATISITSLTAVLLANIFSQKVTTRYYINWTGDIVKETMLKNFSLFKINDKTLNKINDLSILIFFGSIVTAMPSFLIFFEKGTLKLSKPTDFFSFNKDNFWHDPKYRLKIRNDFIKKIQEGNFSFSRDIALIEKYQLFSRTELLRLMKNNIKDLTHSQILQIHGENFIYYADQETLKLLKIKFSEEYRIQIINILKKNPNDLQNLINKLYENHPKSLIALYFLPSKNISLETRSAKQNKYFTEAFKRKFFLEHAEELSKMTFSEIYKNFNSNINTLQHYLDDYTTKLLKEKYLAEFKTEGILSYFILLKDPFHKKVISILSITQKDFSQTNSRC